MPTSAVEPCIFVIMGATGDLTRRKLFPAVCRLVAQSLLPDRFIILGAARTSTLGDKEFRDEAREVLQTAGLPTEDFRRWCDECLYFQRMPGHDPEDYQALTARIAKLEKAHQLPGNRAFYLALPPNVFPAAIRGLGEAGLNRSPGWTRLVIEKPFGRDLKSAEDLNCIVHRYFDESQVYRIDHYLGKETVQNLFAFRFANPIFETLWNRDRVESVQITVAEGIGMEGRGGYYEESGVLRDMVQNHLTQLLTVVAMEVPSSFTADPIRNEKMKVLESITPIKPEDAVLGQYREGVINGSPVPAYRDEPKVARNSQVPTFAAIKLNIATWRWHGVPFYLRTGKRMRRRISEIVVGFRCPPVLIFQPFHDCVIHSNVLVITIQPDEGFDLWIEVKIPGAGMKLQRHPLHFRYSEVFRNIPEAYETLLLDFLTGDQTLFVRADLVEAAWRLYDPLLQHPPEIHPYTSGTWGPDAANQLVEKHGSQWFSK